MCCKEKNKYLTLCMNELDEFIENVKDESTAISNEYDQIRIEAFKELKETLSRMVALMNDYRVSFDNDKNIDRSKVKLALNFIQMQINYKRSSNDQEYFIWRKAMRNTINYLFNIINY